VKLENITVLCCSVVYTTLQHSTVIFSNFTLTQHRLVAAVHTCEVVKNEQVVHMAGA